MRNVLYKNKLLAMFALVMIVLLATREETSYHVQGVDGQPLNDVSYTFQMQREYDAHIKRRIDAYNLKNI